MSGEEDLDSDEESHTKKCRFIPKKLKELKEMEEQAIFDYIEKLHTLLCKNARKLAKYKNKIRKLAKQAKQPPPEQEIAVKATPASKVDAGATPPEATTPADAIPSQDKAAAPEEGIASALDFVAEIRQAAEQAQSLSDFVYEPTSGLYYDQKTGYYYNAEYGLYYDGNTGCYYSYDQEKNAFTFHSQVAAQPDEKAAQATADNAHQKDDDDDDEEIVEFDETGGVITDAKRLKKIRKAKKKEQRHRERLKRRNRKRRKKRDREKDKDEKSRKKPTKSKKAKVEKSKKKRSKHSVSEESDEEADNHNKQQKDKAQRPKSSMDMEDGELDESSSSSESDSDSSISSSSEESDSSDAGHGSLDEDGVPVFKSGSCFQDIAKKYPPSLRIIVQETNLNDLKVGSLSLITYKGGTLGREGAHDVIIPDVNVSKSHLEFKYNRTDSTYMCLDLGSRNGTVLNGSRLTPSAKKDSAIGERLLHGSVIQVGQTKLLCHIHEGNSTCGLCEPGLLIEPVREMTATLAANNAGVHTLTHKEQLKLLQKKYGLENEKFMDNGGKAGASSGGSYNDRAATRRTQVGSSTDKEKTQVASVDTAISSENKGFKMLSKLGWSKGEALGKTSASGGLLEPINVSSNQGKVGLGCDDPIARLDMSVLDQKKISTWKKAQERYQKTTDIFNNSDDDTN